MTTPTAAPDIEAMIRDLLFNVKDAAVEVSRRPSEANFVRLSAAEGALRTALVAGAKAVEEVAALKADNERKDAALRGLRIMFKNDGEGSIEHYDRVAEVFRLRTGFMRPGKSQPMHYSHTDDERSAAWEKWVADLLSNADAALAKKEPAHE